MKEKNTCFIFVEMNIIDIVFLKKILSCKGQYYYTYNTKLENCS